ncbi:MAG TPA: alginate export family protein [Opitutaceae bacterium]|nr:alginate export family protein [Opitutaceae bacterium]
MHARQGTTFAVLLLAAAFPAAAQYVPPSPAAPVPGAIDDFLKAEPAFKGWDFVVNERLRFEDKSDGGTTHAGSNFDFFSAPPSDNSNQYWLSRLMPRIGYASDLFAFVVEARSSYSIGDDRYTATAAGRNLAENDGPFQLQMAYVLIGNPKEFPVTATVGRQELNYGDQRLVGNAFWLNIPHTFDAVKLRYQNSFLGVDVFAADLVYVESDHFEKGNSQDTLSGAYFDFPGLSKDNVTELYLFARNVARGIVTDNWSLVPAPFRFTAPQDIYTLGYHAKSKPGALGPWDYGIEVMWQFGDRTAVFPATAVAAAKAAPRLDQNAWAFVVQGGHTWKDEGWTPRLALIVSCASGDQNSKDQDSQTFQNLLPSNHGIYGIMDLSSLQNIEDLRLSLSAKPSAVTSLALDVHQQYLETTNDYWYNVAGVPRNTAGAAPGSGKGFGINPTYGSDLGQEVDAIGGWAVHRGVLLELGLGHFFRGQYVKESLRAVGSRDANYCYLQATLNF